MGEVTLSNSKKESNEEVTKVAFPVKQMTEKPQNVSSPIKTTLFYGHCSRPRNGTTMASQYTNVLYPCHAE